MISGKDTVTKSLILQTLLKDETPASESLDKLIQYAAHRGATDLFCTAQKDGYALALRCDGVIQPLGHAPKTWSEHLIGHAKVEASMDIADPRKPLDGRIAVLQPDHVIDVRVNTLPTFYGEDAAFRILDYSSQKLNIEQLGLLDEDHRLMQQMIRKPNGLILISGATGAGKTTTLYAILNELSEGQLKINTIEDPVEINLPGIQQSQVNPRIDLDFRDLLPSVLRQGPDVIMVGEVRDKETATTCVRAAATGQLVFATTHSSSSAGAIHTLLGFDVNPHLLAGCLRAVIAQNLLRRVCNDCAVDRPNDPLPFALDDVQPLLPANHQPRLRRGSGCENCTMTGYRRQLGIFSILRCTPAIQELIEQQARPQTIEAKALEEGMISLERIAKCKVARGITTPEEVIRVLGTID